MCRVDANVVQCVQEENPNAQAQARPARESQCAKARNFWQAGNTYRCERQHHVVRQWLTENGAPSSSTPTRKHSI